MALSHIYPFLSLINNTETKPPYWFPCLLILLQSFIIISCHVSLLLKNQVKLYIFQNVLQFYLAFINSVWVPPRGLFYSQAPPTHRPLLHSDPTHSQVPPTIRLHPLIGPAHYWTPPAGRSSCSLTVLNQGDYIFYLHFPHIENPSLPATR